MKKEIYEIEQGRVCQYTTFDLEKGGKTKYIAPGERRTVIESTDTGIITRLWMTFPGWFWRYWDEYARVDASVLRLTILRMYFDGASRPSVAAPAGDFFGVGHMEYRQYLSKYLGMSSGGFYSYFPLPFKGGFRLEIENLHPTETVEVFLNLNCRLLQTLPDDAGRFHCAFRCGENTGSEPIEIADISGNGHLAGCALSIQGKQPNCLSYLEAPEYIWIDGAQTPCIVGTGMEDFFNGGWYFRNGEFSGDLHGVPLKDPLRSMVTMYRFLDEDRVLFGSSLRMAFINPWSRERLKQFIHSSTVYYYLRTAAEACWPLPGRQDLSKLYHVRDADFQSIP